MAGENGNRVARLVDQVGPERFGLLVNSVLSARRQLAQELGLEAYGGKRDYNTVLGYPSSLTVAEYKSRYYRQDIAGRIVDLPAQDTWKNPPQISEDGRDDTAFAQAWHQVEQRLRVFAMLTRLDRVAGIGRFGVLYIGYKDGNEQVNLPVDTKKLKAPTDVLFLRPFSEAVAVIKEFEKSKQSPRYGLPTMYELDTDDGKVQVHHSRVLHVADNRLDSEVYGTPRLRGVYNRLDDLLKIVGGSAEATWLNMRPGTLLTTQDGYALDISDEAKMERQNEIEEFLHGIARFLTLEGMDLKTVSGQVIDPTGPFEAQISLISAASGIPQRVLLGSAAGELAAAREDMRQWYGTIASRQRSFAEPDVLRPLINTWVEYGILPRPANGYHVGEKDERGQWTWPSLFELTAEEDAGVTEARAGAVAELRDPVTGELPLTRDEVRRLLGYGAMANRSGGSGTREAGTEEEEPAGSVVAQMARGNYRAGSISRDVYGDWLSEELADLGRQTPADPGC